VTRTKRPTIADVARSAGVSKGAVSYALNGLPGVSEITRARIMGVAGELGWQPLPAVVIGGRGRHGGHPRIWSDDAQAVRTVVRYLAALDHRRIARVAGRPDFLHTQVRTDAFHEACAALGITERTVVTDFSGDQGSDATRELLSSSPRPTALLFDNDVMAVAGSGVAHEMGLVVPRDVSIVAWDDSVLCRLVHPPLSALSRDIATFGRHAAQLLLDHAAGRQVTDLEDPPPRLVPRGSTAPAPA